MGIHTDSIRNRINAMHTVWQRAVAALTVEQMNAQERTGVTVAGFGRVEPVSEMEHQRITDLDAWRAYQAAVIVRTNEAMESMTEANLSDVVMDRLPADAQNVYYALVVGPDGSIRKLEAWECFVYQHGLRHIGEVEFSRGLVGLGGLTG